MESCEVDGFRADFVAWGHYRPEYWRNYRHRHSFHEVCLAYAGEGRFSTGATDHTVGPGTLFLARPGDLHEIESSRTDPLGIAFWGFTLRPLTPPTGTGWWSGLTRPDGLVVSATLGSLTATVAALAAEATTPRSGHRTALTTLGTLLVLDTARAFARDDDLAVEPAYRSQPRDRTLVEAMHRLLQDNLARPITVRDVAAAVHLSERHAERLFRTHTGTSLIATLRRLRLEDAAQLLFDPSLTVAQVAHAVGYTDPRPFTTAFRRHHGVTPTAHRRANGTIFTGRPAERC